MSFWDTATGVVQLRKKREQELNRVLSSREFESFLKTEGVYSDKKINSREIQLFVFAVENFHFLDQEEVKWYRDILSEHLLKLIRPLYQNLEGLWVKHPRNNIKNFAEHFHTWVSQYSMHHSAYEPELLTEHLKLMASVELGYSIEQINIMLTAYALSPAASIQELMVPPAPALPQSVATQATHATQNPVAPTAANDPGLQALAKTLAGKAPNASITSALDSDFDEGDDTPSGLDDSSPTSSKLFVASNLVPDHLRGSNAGADEQHQAQQQADLPGTSALEAAANRVRAAIFNLADVAAVQPYVVEAMGMPLGNFMEVPPEGKLGESAQELPIQAWWLMAHLAGQLNIQALEFKNPEGEDALTDTGVRGFRHALSTADTDSEQVDTDGDAEGVGSWSYAVSMCLGGEALLEIDFLLGILLTPTHPLSAPALEAITAVHEFNRIEQENS